MSRYTLYSLIVIACLTVPAPLQAVVETIDATVTSQVEQTLPSGEINTDLVFESLGESTGNLPLSALAKLSDSGYPNSGAAASTRLADPRAVMASDPAELGIAVVSNSTNAPSSWSASGTATETREIVFTAQEIFAESGVNLTAYSYFYLDAVLVVWRQAGATDLTGTAAEISIRVDQSRAGSADANSLSATVSLTGQADGTATLTTGGYLVPENVVQIDVSDLVPSMESVQVVILPKLAIPYEYPAAVDEIFKLTAKIDGRIQSQPDMGAAVLAGVSLDEVGNFISDVAGQDLGLILSQVLDLAVKENPVPARPLTTDDASTKVVVDPQARLIPWWPGTLCGTLGVESLAALAVFAGVVGIGAMRRLETL